MDAVAAPVAVDVVVAGTLPLAPLLPRDARLKELRSGTVCSRAMPIIKFSKLACADPSSAKGLPLAVTCGATWRGSWDSSTMASWKPWLVRLAWS